jgi:UDPglucose 6-dehydrogenase
MPGVTMAPSAYEAIAGADAVALVTEWDAFRALDLKRIKDLARTPVLVDLRNIYDPTEVRALGFTYVSIGRM